MEATLADPGPEHLETSQFAVWMEGRMRRMRLSQSEISRRVNVSQSLVSRWLKGKGVPGRDVSERLAEVLDVPLNEILVKAGHLPREIRLGPSAKHTHLHDLIDDLPEGLIDPLINMVEAIIRETR